MSEALPRHVVRTGALKREEAMHIRHPLNPRSDVALHALTRGGGMKRAHLNLGRITRGKASDLPHAHAQLEEFNFSSRARPPSRSATAASSSGPAISSGFRRT